MSLTALQQALQNTSETARTREYRGATTAASFADPQAELGHFRSGAAVYDLGFRAKIVLRGGDRMRWLNGMVTNNIRDLAPGFGLYAFLLNPQGHILGDLYAYNSGEVLLLDTDLTQVEKLLATFDHYIIMDDVEVNNLSESMTALGVAGPKAGEVLLAAGFDVTGLAPGQTRDLHRHGIDCTLVRAEESQPNSYEVWLPPSDVKELWDSLLKAGAVAAGSDAVEMHRILLGIPLYGTDIRERDLPQETEQARALNFNKGCYVGQEIVERIRSRGNVHRKFTGFVGEPGSEIVRGVKIVVGEKEVGEITSAAPIQFPGGARTVALGYIRREVGVPGREITVAGAKATVAQLPVDINAFAMHEPSLAGQ